ncbi:AbrB/MazE/SpoVT family DNA-binding domain-containing protein [Candidatus Woesearchaeota archaeon]|nr:AbrB/MazE/SpoVT family DNA-binding domain-containing protein [Candidatus Woesearchaeota archaeon]
MKLQDNKGQYKLTIPKDLAKVKGWKQGTELAVVMNQEGDLVIKEIKKKR